MIDQHGSLAEKFIKKGFWLYLFSFIIAPMGYIIKIIVSGELTVSEVGILYGIISLITLLSAYNDFGMSESINHFVPKFITEKRYDKIKTILVYAFIAQMTTGVIIASGFYFGSEWVSIHFFKSESAGAILKIFALYFLGINIMQILSTFFISIQNTFLQKIIEFIRMSFTLIGTMGLFFLDLGNIVQYSFAWIGGLYIGIIFAIIIFYSKYYSKYFQQESILWDKKLFGEIFKYGLYVFLGAQAGVILSQIDMQMIIYILGTNDAGYYTNYLSIISIPFMIIGPIFGLLFPMFSEMHSKGDTQKIALIKEVFTNNFVIIGIAFNFFLFTLAIPISYTLFGEKFITSGVILQYSVLFLVFNFLLQINFNILAGVGRVKERVLIVSIGVIINVITNIIFINLMGVSGAAIATGIGWICIWLMSEYKLKGNYIITIAWKNIIKNIILLGTLSLSFIYYFNNFVNFSELFSRKEGFLILLFSSCIYSCIFIGINYSMFTEFVFEVRKLKK